MYVHISNSDKPFSKMSGWGSATHIWG